MKRIVPYLIGIVSALPLAALAHVKWFVDPAVETAGFTTYQLSSGEVVVWSVIVLVALVIASVLDRVLKTPRSLTTFVEKHHRAINRTGQVALGLFLLAISGIWQVVISPDVHVVGPFTYLLFAAQVIVGLMFIGGWRVRWASGVLAAITVAAATIAGGVSLFENAIVFGLAGYFYIQSLPLSSGLHRYAVPLVRIGTGVSLITLAFTEKFLSPELSVQFLSLHQWNFMQPILPWFTDSLFVLSTGFAELLFGLVFVFGYITRINTAAIAVFFGCSVTAMLLQAGKWEAEDLIVYAAAIVLLAYGSGEKHHRGQ